ncbi:MAG TPA: 5-formyltetrahydrofolate cyclo-ligase [Verrucomicrobiae bacterium]|nr:5-formyltetrahydrofolate cyclo-ligase [Verrucomicrobiae bacterium]
MSEKKSRLKNKYLALRENLSPYEAFKKSLHIQDFFLNSHYFSNSKTIGAYFPILNEVQTFEVIQKSLSCKKKICLPRLDNNEINFYQFSAYDNLVKGKYNIFEPKIDNNNLCEDMDIIIIPGVAFDKRGYRIGYGKGYYDKFLNKFLNKNLTLIGFGYEFQILSFNMPTEVHDVKMDAIITNKEILLTA